jgi:site-specific recombinase XerD
LLELLDHFGEQIDQLTAKNLRQFVLDCAARHGKGRAKTTVTAVRMFVRFLIATGHSEPGLDDAIPTIAEWRLSSLPRYLPGEEIEQIIDSCDTTVSLGIRDRAVLLLLARLGLRAGDVAGLQVTDINWQEGTILVMGKNRCQTQLPLPQEVGDAIWNYLHHARPPISSNNLFISAVAPWVALTRQAVGHIAKRAIKRTGVEAPHFGAHVFRHSAATAMLSQGVSLQGIGEVLRHRSIETTAHYAKIDTALLKQVVQPWPEGTSC